MDAFYISGKCLTGFILWSVCEQRPSIKSQMSIRVDDAHEIQSALFKKKKKKSNNSSFLLSIFAILLMILCVFFFLINPAIL